MTATPTPDVARESAPSPYTRGLSVLIVADRPQDVEVLSLTLEAVGCDVAAAPYGPAAVELAQLAQPDVVVIAADPSDGFAVARSIADRAGWRKPFVVALTARGTAEGYRQSQAAGVHLYAERPVSPDLLVGLIRRFRSLLAGIAGFDPAI